MSYKLVVADRVQANKDVDEVREHLNRIFKVPSDKKNIFLNGKPVAVKSGVDLTAARRFKSAIEQTGAVGIILDEKTQQEVETCSRCKHLVLPSERVAAIERTNRDECPNCGLILSNKQKIPPVRSWEEREASSGQKKYNRKTTTEGKNSVEQELPVSFNRRLLAGWHTLLCTGILAWAISLPFMAIFWLYTRHHLMTATTLTTVEAETSLLMVNIIALLITIAVYIYALIVVPSRRGQTWGQTYYDIQVVDGRGDPVDSFFRWGLRFLGNIICWFTYALPLLLLKYLKPGHSLSDVMSGTRLTAVSSRQPKFDTGLFAVAFCINIIGILCVQSIEFNAKGILDNRFGNSKAPAVLQIRENMRSSRERATEQMVRQKMAIACMEQGDEEACKLLELMGDGGR